MKQVILPALAVAALWAFACGAETPQESLILWLDAAAAASMGLEDGHVAWWQNRAPGFTNRLTSEPHRRPTLAAHDGKPARPAVFFDGVDDVLRDTAFGQACDAWALVLVAAPFSGGPGGGLCTARSRDGHDYDPGFTVDLFASGGAFDQISIEGAGRIGGQQDQLESAFPYGTPHVLIVERDRQEVRLYVDGVLEGTRPVRPAKTVMDEVRIGARCFGGSERVHFRGEIAEALLYARVLTPEERTAIVASRQVSAEESRMVREEFMDAEEERAKNRMIPAKVTKEWPDAEAFAAASGTDFSRLPVRTDLGAAIRLAAVHLTSLFDADKDNEPFFFSDLRPDGTGVMHHSVNIGIPHVVGRCLLGCTEAEQATGFPFPPEGLSILERYCKSSFNNPNHLNSYFDPDKENKRFIEFHNMREGLYGLWALMQRPGSDWARDKAHKMVRTLQAITDENGRWSPALAAEQGMDGLCYGIFRPQCRADARSLAGLLPAHRRPRRPGPRGALRAGRPGRDVRRGRPVHGVAAFLGTCSQHHLRPQRHHGLRHPLEGRRDACDMPADHGRRRPGIPQFMGMGR